MKIARTEMFSSFHSFLNKQSGIIYGAPGAGKSYIVEKGVEELLAKKRVALMIPVDQLSRGDAEEVKSLLGTNEKLEVFLNSLSLNSKESAIIIFDGLDAARNSTIDNNILSLLSQLRRELKNWGVFATIREFDLFKNDLVKNAFGIKTAQKTDKLFFVSELSDADVFEGFTSLGHDSSSIWSKLSDNTKSLLRNPFCLWIFTSLLEQVAVEAIDNIGTEVELLDRYFEEIIGRNKDTVNVLSQIARSMVQQGRLSIVPDGIVTNPGFEKILSLEILLYSTIAKDRVSFKHNIFFDYFVSCFCFGETGKEFIQFIESDNVYPVFLQQSIRYFFFRLWLLKRDEFWLAFDRCLNNENASVQLLSRTVPYMPILTCLDTVKDIEPGIANQKTKDIFLKFYTHGLKLFPGLQREKRPAIYEFIFKNSNDETFWSISSSISKEVEDGMFNDQKSEISRLLLQAYERAGESKDNGNMEFLKSFWLLPALLKTMPADKEKKVAIVKKIISSIGADGYSVKEVYKLATEIEEVILHTPELASEVYGAVFKYEEKRADAVSFGTPIMPMQSNIKQDYSMAYYQLHDSFDYFCKTHFEWAMKTAFLAGEGEIEREHSSEKVDVYKFNFRGKDVEIHEDYSYIWGGNENLDDYGLKITDHLFAILDENLSEKPELTDSILPYYSEAPRKMYFFTHLIELLVKAPERYKDIIAAILNTADFLYSNESFYICQLFEKSFVYLSPADRLKVETNAWKYFDEIEDEKKQFFGRDLERYFSLVPHGQLQDERSVKASEDGKARGFMKPKKNRIDFEWKQVDETESLLRQGIDSKQVSNQQILDKISLLQSVEKVEPFDQLKYSGIIQEAIEMYVNNSGQPVQTKLLTDVLDSFNKCIFKCEKWTDKELEHFLYFLKQGAAHTDPVFDEKYHSEFDHPHWSSSPRTEAAEFVFKLGLSLKENKEIEAVAQKLAVDPVPSVRYLVLIEIFRLWFSNQDLFWVLVDKIYDQEKHRSIQLAIAHSVSKIYRKDAEKADKFFDARFNVSEKDELSKFYARSIVDLAMLGIGTFGVSRLENIVASPESFPHILVTVVNSLIKYTFKETGDDEKQGDQAKAISVLDRLITNSSEYLLGKSDEHAREVYQVISETILRTYFATDDERIKTEELDQLESRLKISKKVMETLKKYLDENGELDPYTLYMLSQYSFNMLNHDPKFAISLVYSGIYSNKKGSYRLDSMAVKELVQFIERVLSKHKDILKEDKGLMEMILSILSVFADVGWPEALALVWKLDKVYR